MNHEVMSPEILAQACDKLGWEYEVRGQETVVKSVGNSIDFRGEPAIRVMGNQVIWNRYYMNDGRQRVKELKSAYESLYAEFRVEYARESILREFRNRGFSMIEDLHFVPNEREKHRFTLKGRSKLRNEDEQVAKIKVTILADGTIETDSSYIPEDIHKLADEAMEAIEAHFGRKRSISPKEIPVKYKSKAFCKNPNVINLRNGII